MARGLSRQTREVHDHALDLPSLFRPVALREAGDAFAYACTHAAELGAGALVHVGRFDVAELAIVLEPEEPLAEARRSFYVGMVALGDALVALAPPEKPITVGWPDAIFVDGGLVGGGRLGWPDPAAETAVPAWLVFGAMIRTTSLNGAEPGLLGAEPGLLPVATALDEEGFEGASAERLIEGFARHLMTSVDRWGEAGFSGVVTEYRGRLKHEKGTVSVIDNNGDLQVRSAGGLVARRKLRAALRTPSWLDPSTRGPRL